MSSAFEHLELRASGDATRLELRVKPRASRSQVLGVREVGFDTQTLFAYRGAGDDGGFGATGAVPRFWAELDSRGIKADAGIFKG